MPLVYIRPVGNNVAYIEPIGGTDPAYGRPDIGWGHPDAGLPGGGHPWLPGHVGGPRPDAGLPGSPGHPDNRPPSGPPPQVGPGEVLVLVRDQAGVWHYASLPSGSAPPKPVPVPPPTYPTGQPVPPVATPTPAPKPA